MEGAINHQELSAITSKRLQRIARAAQNPADVLKAADLSVKELVELWHDMEPGGDACIFLTEDAAFELQTEVEKQLRAIGYF